MPTDKELLTQLYRCNVCNVTSRGLIQHDKHLEGKRHKQNVAIACGEAAGPRPQQKRPAGQNESKPERKKRLEQEAVARASLLLNPALQQRPSFTHTVLNWPASTWSAGSRPLPLPEAPLPKRFDSSDAYLEAFEPFLLEEARCHLHTGLESREATAHFILRSFRAGGEVSKYIGLDDPTALAFSVPESAEGEARQSRVQAGSAVLLTPPASLIGGGGGGLPEGWREYKRSDGRPYYHHKAHNITQWVKPEPETIPAALLGLATQRTKLSVEIEVVLPQGLVTKLEAGQVWEAQLLGSLASVMRMYDSCVGLRNEMPPRFTRHLLDGFPTAPMGSAGAPSPGPHTSLNPSQRAGVDALLSSSPPTQQQGQICLLHGPPGTGKTTTILSCLEALRSAPAAAKGGSPRRVLVCAPSNRAAQELCSRHIDRYPEVPVSLIGVEEAIPAGEDGAKLREVFLHGWAEDLAGRIRRWMESAAGAPHQPLVAALKETLASAKRRAPDGWERLCGEDARAVDRWLQRVSSGVPSLSLPSSLDSIVGSLLGASATPALSGPLETELLATAELVFCTLATTGRPSLAGRLGASALVVDEAGQAVEPEVLIAVRQANYGGQLTRCLLVGDPEQLPATVLSMRSAELGFDRSMLQRLMAGTRAAAMGSQHCVMLDEQHRMDPEIAQWPNQRFYSGRLRDAQCVRDGRRRLDLGLGLGPYTVIDVSSEYCRQHGQGGAVKAGTSLSNPGEASLAARFVAHVVQSSKVSPDRVVVITFYSAQVALIQRELYGAQVEGVRVATVDGFQGAESDIVVLSFVRGQGTMGVGFLKDYRRLNVALTRAKCVLVALADVASLTRDPSWDVAALCRDAEERRVVVPAESFRSRLG